jgi:preprotein translocase subunit SecG
MLFNIFIVLLLLDSLLLATVVLLQAGQGGGLAGLGGGASTDTFLGGRQATTVLTKLSWWCGAMFLGFSVILAGLGTGTSAPRSVLENQFQIQPVNSPTGAPPVQVNPTDIVNPGTATRPPDSN